MLTHQEQKHVPYTPEQMFDLVAAVNKYHEFLPWCTASRINRHEGDSVFYADLVVGYKLLREKFTSKVVLDHPDHIYIEYMDGPLKHLKNHWRFIPQEAGACLIDFKVEFEFKNSVLQKLSEVFFEKVIHRMIDAFEARAEELYQEPR